MIKPSKLSAGVMTNNRRWQKLVFDLQKMPAISSVQILSPRLNDYPPELILSSPYLMKEFDKKVIDDYLAALEPENVLISISSPGFKGKEIEKNFSVSFDLDRNPIALDPIDSKFEELPKKILLYPVC